MDKYQTFEYDVVVVGAGGAGLRAAIEASAQGARTALVCKSLLGKAHTVMAEGGVAAALWLTFARSARASRRGERTWPFPAAAIALIIGTFIAGAVVASVYPQF